MTESRSTAASEAIDTTFEALAEAYAEVWWSYGNALESGTFDEVIQLGQERELALERMRNALTPPSVAILPPEAGTTEAQIETVANLIGVHRPTIIKRHFTHDDLRDVATRILATILPPGERRLDEEGVLDSLRMVQETVQTLSGKVYAMTAEDRDGRAHFTMTAEDFNDTIDWAALDDAVARLHAIVDGAGDG